MRKKKLDEGGKEWGGLRGEKRETVSCSIIFFPTKGDKKESSVFFGCCFFFLFFVVLSEFFFLVLFGKSHHQLKQVVSNVQLPTLPKN